MTVSSHTSWQFSISRTSFCHWSVAAALPRRCLSDILSSRKVLACFSTIYGSARPRSISESGTSRCRHWVRKLVNRSTGKTRENPPPSHNGRRENRAKKQGLAKCEHFIGVAFMDQRVGAAIAFMKMNLHRKLSLSEIAESVNLSPSHLRSLFKTETGTSIVPYLKQLRLECARHLLESTFLSVKQVASSVGLNGVSHFVRDFAKTYRRTPARYARCYRKVSQTP